ncbi:MAG: coiled-coil domain containing 126 [Phycisphaerae bacterium]|nr:coiled-coil domain containing 126 [Phycisphaerae bacterium]
MIIKASKFVFIVVFVMFSGQFAFGMATETHGNKPLNALNFKSFPGIMPVVNHQSRVYHTWCNGNEFCYYRSDTAGLNDALKKFAAMDEMAVREVVFRPGKGQVKAFDGKTAIHYDWYFHIVGGIARASSKRDKGALIWSRSPMMVVYIGDGQIELDKIKIPKGVTVVQLADLSKRYIKAFDSKEKNVRGWGSHRLADLDLYNTDNLTAIAKLLDDEDSWVRLNVVGAVARYGKLAEGLLPKLNAMLPGSNENLKKKIQQAIQQIKAAKDNAKAAKKHNEILKKISKFFKKQPQDAPNRVNTEAK